MTVYRRRNLWLWFAIGFVVVFIGFLVFYPVTAMHPSGQYILRQPLWGFYVNTLPGLFGPVTLGPASSNSGELIGMVFLHVAISAVGGGIAALIGWWRLRRRGQM